MVGKGVGARLRRKEDARFLHGRGEYVPNIEMVGMQNVAFVRSSVAHGRIRSIVKPAGFAQAVFTIDDLIGVKPIVANSALPGFKTSSQPALAQGKVRFVGETIAMCVAPTRAEAEDIAAMVEVDIEPLPAVTEMLMARNTEGPRVHEHWSDNVFLETKTEADLTDIKAKAAIKVRRHIRTARQSMAPIEGRGVVAMFDRRLDQLLMYSSAQMPHINRAGLSECLGIDQGRIRVVSPDVGGGFGYKALLLAEEVCLAWLAMRL